jgi:mannosylglycerate hydrolase
MTTIHLVSHTHWDREWYLTFQQFRIRLVKMIDKLLNVLDEDKEFMHFMLDGQTILLNDYLHIRPDKEEKLRQYILDGSIIIGPWYVLPDEFLVSPEALIRNLLMGEQISKSFGSIMKIGYIPDTFGHIGQMPQILRGFNFNSACLQRGLSDEPCEVWWEAPDGSRVLMVYLRDSYGNASSIPVDEPDGIVQQILSLRDSLTPYSFTNQILLMHGTDHTEPSPGTSTAIRAANLVLSEDRITHSTLPIFFENIQNYIKQSQTEIPIVTGELRSSKRHHLLPGVLSTRVWVKQRNNACELLLERWSETFSSIASMYDSLKSDQWVCHINNAWQLLLECHPHDSICGCSIDQVHDEMRSRFDQVEQIGEEITHQSLVNLTQLISTLPSQATSCNHNNEQSPIALVVFNSGSIPANQVVQVDLPTTRHPFYLVDESGTRVPYMALKSKSPTVDDELGTPQIQFLAKDVPAIGYRTYWSNNSVHKELNPLNTSTFLTEHNKITNEILSIDVSPENGTFTIIDHRNNVRYAGLNRFWDGGDCGDQYNYCPPSIDQILTTHILSIKKINYPEYQSIQITMNMTVPKALSKDRRSRSTKLISMRITTNALITPIVPRVDIHTIVENRALDHRLRVHFPSPFKVSHADYDGHFDVVHRPIDIPIFDSSWVEDPRPEVPQRHFTSVSNEDYGLMVANRGLREAEVFQNPHDKSEIALTLLRCVGWLSRNDFPNRKGHAGPALPTPKAQMLGKWSFDYSIIPFVTNMDNHDFSTAIHQANNFNLPLRVICTNIHSGLLPCVNNFIWAEPKTFHITAIKRAKDNQGWIVRGYNISKITQQVKIHHPTNITVAYRTNLKEEIQTRLEISNTNWIEMTLQGNEIATIKLL